MGRPVPAAPPPELPAPALFLIFGHLVDDYESFGAALLVCRQWRRAGRDPRLSFWASLSVVRWAALHSLKNLQWTDPAPRYRLPFCTCAFIGAVETGVLSGSLRAICLRGTRRPDAPLNAPLANWLSTPITGCTSSRTLLCRRLGLICNVSRGGLTSAGAQRLCDVLCDERSSAVTRVDLGGNNIGDYGAEAFAEMLRYNDTLSVLLLDDNNITSHRHLTQFCVSLYENTTLTELSLSKNAIGDEGATELAEALFENRTTMRVLHLSECGIGSEGVDLLAHSLIYNRSLISLDLSKNPLGPGAVRFGEALGTNTVLRTLDLHRCLDLEEEGFRMVCEGLMQPTSALTALDISYYRPGVAPDSNGHGADYLSQMLTHNRALTFLDFSLGGVGNEGAALLAAALRVNTTLRSLFLVFNGILNEGARQLADALRVNVSLLQLDLSRNIFTDVGVAALLGALAVNATLQALNLEKCGRVSAEMQATVAAAWATRPLDAAFKPASRLHIEELRYSEDV